MGVRSSTSIGSNSLIGNSPRTSGVYGISPRLGGSTSASPRTSRSGAMVMDATSTMRHLEDLDPEYMAPQHSSHQAEQEGRSRELFTPRNNQPPAECPREPPPQKLRYVVAL